MWCDRKLLRMSWLNKVTSQEVLNLLKEKRSLYSSMKRLRDRLLGHTHGYKELEEKILEGTVEERKRKGRQRLEYVK